MFKHTAIKTFLLSQDSLFKSNSVSCDITHGNCIIQPTLITQYKQTLLSPSHTSIHKTKI